MNYINPRMAKYERDIAEGKIPCPFKVVFKDSKGSVVAKFPVPLTPTGIPKLKIFGNERR